MININRLLLIVCLSIGNTIQLTDSLPTSNSTDDLTCDCGTMELVSTGGFAEMYGRYIGTWGNVGTYRGRPLYMCIADCQGLSDKLVIKLFKK